MAFENILVDTEDRISIIRINREKQLNALNKQTINELNQALADAERSSDVRVIILTGNGDKAFVAGADIKEFSSYASKEAFFLILSKNFQNQ